MHFNVKLHTKEQRKEKGIIIKFLVMFLLKEWTRKTNTKPTDGTSRTSNMSKQNEWQKKEKEVKITFLDICNHVE